MLLVVSESAGRTQILNDVAREMSLTLTWFASASKLMELMGGQSRRIVLLSETEVTEAVVRSLDSATAEAALGVVISADREALRLSNKAKTLEKLAAFANVEWIGRDYDFEQLSSAARKCRRRMLRVSKEDLENALSNHELFIQYQPKVERNSGTEWLTREAEALIRWRHPVHGFIGPLEFLPEVEEFGLAGAVGEFVLRQAATQLLAWREHGLVLNSCINLASSLLMDRSLADNYARIVNELGLECGSFTFEVAEPGLADTNAPHLRTLKALREKGFRVCLDNFRVVAASLATFEQLPFDEIKVHASALKRAQDNPVALQVLAAITGLAHNLGMTVCAEGVEDEEVFRFLKTIECDKMQGFLISEAVMPDIMRRVYGPRDSSVNEVA